MPRNRRNVTLNAILIADTSLATNAKNMAVLPGSALWCGMNVLRNRAIGRVKAFSAAHRRHCQGGTAVVMKVHLVVSLMYRI
jgi:hypothetical protein